jgi:CheY-like chemotaxis protein
MADLLIVEDDDDVAFLTEAFLDLEGHQVRRARNGEEGLARLTEGLPDLVVMDVEMPLLSGPGMAARMIAENCGREAIPIIIVSGAFGLGSIARSVGTPYHLTKPYDPADLLILVRRALSEHVAPRPHVGA